jgi:uncharacterized protein
MAKPNREITNEEALDILRAGKYGVLSTVSAQGQPYGVPVNYFYLEQDNCIFFHCARVGKKLDNIAANDRVSFVVIGYEAVVPERFITHYESVVVTGRASLVHDDEEKRARLIQLCERFAPEALERRESVIRQYWKAVDICKITIDEITGKRNNDD